MHACMHMRRVVGRSGGIEVSGSSSEEMPQRPSNSEFRITSPVARFTVYGFALRIPKLGSPVCNRAVAPYI